MEKEVGSHHLTYSDSLVIDSGSTSQQQKGAVGRNILTWLRDWDCVARLAVRSNDRLY